MTNILKSFAAIICGINAISAVIGVLSLLKYPSEGIIGITVSTSFLAVSGILYVLCEISQKLSPPLSLSPIEAPMEDNDEPYDLSPVDQSLPPFPLESPFTARQEPTSNGHSMKP